MGGIAVAPSRHRTAAPVVSTEEAELLGHLPFSPAFWFSFAILGAGTSLYLIGFTMLIVYGHAATGEGSHGAIWGIIVANIVNFIGVSHVGIAISAVVRILKLRTYQQLARLAEFITLAAITTAVCNIAMDVGHPERFIFNVMYYGRWHAPFVWSCTVITTYVVGSSVYLYLAMRRDLWVSSEKAPARRNLFKMMALGYSDSAAARARHNRVVWWLAVVILPIMVSVHSVYGYIFGLQPGRPGWYNPFQAPYFVLGAIVSGFSTVIVALAVLRKTFRWEEVFPPRIFKGLGIFLGFVTLLYMYFLFSEYLTGNYASPEGERAVFHDLLFGRFAKVLWPAVIGGMVVPFAMLFVQGVNRRICSIPLTVVAAILIHTGLWMTRGLIVVPTFYHPLLPWPVAPYTPTLAEWLIVIGSFFMFSFLLLILVKAFPVLELPEEHEEEPVRVPPMPWWKRVVIGGSVLLGVGLIGTGFGTSALPEFYHSPLLWLAGIVTLLSVPFQICVVPERVRRRAARLWVVSQPPVLRAARVRQYVAAAGRRTVRATVRTIPSAGIPSGRL